MLYCVVIANLSKYIENIYSMKPLRSVVVIAYIVFHSFLTGGCVKLIEKKQVDSTKRGNQTYSFQTIEPFKQSPQLNRIQAVIYHRDLLWLGTPKGLYSFNYPSMDMENLPDKPYLPEESITDLSASADGTLYALSKKTGLHALPLGSNEFYSTGSTKIRDIVIKPGDNAVYCATSHGVDVFQGSSWRNIRVKSTSKFASQANDITAITVDSKGTFWLGTTFGLYRMANDNSFDFIYGDYQIVSGNLVINERGNSPLGGNLFYSTSFNSESNRILFSTNGGLSEVSPPEDYKNKNNWKVYTGNHSTSKMINGKIQSVPILGNSPLPTNFIKLSLEIGDNLFIGSDEGLAHLNRRTGDWIQYNIDNQLGGNQVLCLYSSDLKFRKLLFVGTSGGLSILQVSEGQPKEES